MRSIAVAFALVLTPALSAFAQTRVDFTPTVGIYFPLADLADQDPAFTYQDAITVRQDVAPMLGVRVAVWPGTRAGLELSLGYSASGLNDERSIEAPGHLWVGSLRLLLGLAQGSSACTSSEGGCLPALYAAGGVGLITRRGDAWNGVSGTSNLGLSLGAGYRIPAGAVAVRIEGEALLYSSSFTQSGTTTFSQAGIPGNPGAHFQKDLLLSIELTIPLAGGRR